MQKSVAFPADPDGQPLMDILTGLEVDPSQAYNTAKESRTWLART